MRISTEDLSKVLPHYIGGQIRITNANEKLTYHGEIVKAVVENPLLRVGCAWMAKGVGPCLEPEGWVKDPNPDYVVSVDIFTVHDIGPGPRGGGHRLHLRSHTHIGETVVLFPPDGRVLDPAEVKDLDPAPAA